MYKALFGAPTFGELENISWTSTVAGNGAGYSQSYKYFEIIFTIRTFFFPLQKISFLSKTYFDQVELQLYTVEREWAIFHWFWMHAERCPFF